MMSDHEPVLVRPVVGLLGPVCRSAFIDGTLGLAGHAAAILEAGPASLRLIGLDLSEANLTAAAERLAPYGSRITLIRENFANVDAALRQAGIDQADALLADLGVSSNQIADPQMGLSFEVDGPLDMRLDRRAGPTAADLVNNLPEAELADLLYLQAQERRSRRIARTICEARRRARIVSTVQLARLVCDALGAAPRGRRQRTHPATRTFLALRIAVNAELANLEALLVWAPRVVRPGGRVGIISFQSAEDRIVKQTFRRWARAGQATIVTRKPVSADDDEQRRNPRSRSARFRVVEMADSSLRTA